tara:strand:- start:11993 stop:13192 length:1200 start_codon:yes stop_codon:yes gene_type:complete
MAIYKIFPTQDTTLYSSHPSMNTGIDAILEASNKLGIDGLPDVARYLVQFDNSEINDIITNKISGSTYSVYLTNFISEIQGITSNTFLEILPLAQSWDNGTGQTLDNPITENGCSWGYTDFSGSTSWSPSGDYDGTEGVISYTSSFNPLYSTQGGGNWFFNGSNNLLYVLAGYVLDNYIDNIITSNPNVISQSFNVRDTKDLEAKVDNIVNNWYSGSIPNYGFIVKLADSFEFNPSQYVQPQFKYYSVDTNTIYPPQLEFRWRDYSLYSPSTSSIVTTEQLKLSLSENPGIFTPESINRFYINVSPLYPTRIYKTSSLFTDLNYLPTSSYYAVKDLDTNEFIINFDDQYTQISSDERGNYFDVYMSGLEPERYYKILIKTVLNNSTKIFDDNYYFKVIN